VSGAGAQYTNYSNHRLSLAERLNDAVSVLDAQLAESQERRDLHLTVGRQQQALDRAARRIASLEDEIDYWRARWRIMQDERNRAEARVGEIEGRLDVVYSLARRRAAGASQTEWRAAS
jgi:chromosome segregation ATPase